MFKMFKKYFLIMLLVLGVCFGTAAIAITADSVAMEWTANTEPDLAGYRVYRSDNGAAFVFIDQIPCGPSDSTCADFIDLNLPDGNYRWYVTAYDDTVPDENESGPSNIVEKDIITPIPVDTTPPDNPTGLRFP
ncbi:hypothetical protein KAR91_80365 [Candidatus Pacearchaeota archaeon]|nr:hypothetical protein [Candidatus Pacearchaeota archaeon]